MSVKNYSLLIIDDDPDDHHFIKESAEALDVNLELRFYFTAVQALKDLEQGSVVAPDAIITDVNMPLMNGFHFLEKIKSIAVLKQIPVIVHSTSEDLETKQRVLDLGAYCYVAKSADFTQLLKALKAIFS